jgi:large subunit ribosomal protein L9
MPAMEVILLERIESLGQMGDVVKVKPGFARNFLLPQRKAMRATKENLAHFEKQRTQLEAQNLQRRQDAEKVSARMAELSVIVIRQAGETGQLYGSVTSRDIAEAVTAAGFTVGRSQVLLQQPIKSLGVHATRVALHPEVVISVKVNVAQSEEEAKMQAEGKAPAPAAAEPAADAASPAAALAAAEVKAAEVVDSDAKPKAKGKAKKAKAED